MTEQKDFADGIDTEYLDRLGRLCYGEQWPIVRAHNIERLKGNDQSPLGQEECMRLVNGLLRLVEMRRGR